MGSIVQGDEVTGSVLERYFSINPETGSIKRNLIGSRRQNREMGYVKPGSQSMGGGYVIVSVPVGHRKYRQMRGHHLVWMWAYGSVPDGEIDHINGDRADNRISNLRLATVSQNRTNKGRQSNNQSGFKWVYKCSQKPGKWRSEVTFRDENGNSKKARFVRNSPEEAYQAALEVARKYHGCWCNPGEG